MAAKIHQFETSAAAQESGSLLAFHFDENGGPVVVAEFETVKDKMALCFLARSILDQLSRDNGTEWKSTDESSNRQSLTAGFQSGKNFALAS